MELLSTFVHYHVSLTTAIIEDCAMYAPYLLLHLHTIFALALHCEFLHHYSVLRFITITAITKAHETII